MQGPTERFSDRVDDYVRFRPSYPSQVIDLISEVASVDKSTKVADIGCGTGIFTALLTRLNCQIVGIEPNDPMRAAAFQALKQITFVKATAEETRLEANSVDVITAAQAFHWFDKEKCQQEFRRVLKPDGWVFLVWNGRKSTGSEFLAKYELVLQEFVPDYTKLGHRSTPDEDILAWFGPSSAQSARFDNSQSIDLQGLLGRAYSSSYVPAAGTKEREELTKELSKVFEACQHDGLVRMEYETKVYFGHL